MEGRSEKQTEQKKEFRWKMEANILSRVRTHSAINSMVGDFFKEEGGKKARLEYDEQQNTIHTLWREMISAH